MHIQIRQCQDSLQAFHRFLIQISYASSCKCLSDKKRFPSFVRTTPSDDFQSSAIARLVKYFHWVYMGVLAVGDEYGKSAVAQFITEAEHDGICIAFNEVLNPEHPINNLKHIGNS